MLSQILEQSFDIRNVCQKMIVIRQDHPGVNVLAGLLAQFQEISFERADSRWIRSNDRPVFITGCGNQIVLVFALVVRRTMPGMPMNLPLKQNRLPLLRSHLPPAIHV